MTHLFIINGRAGRGKRKRALDRLLADIGRLAGETVIEFTHPPAQGAGQIARSWAEKGIPLRIYACGGDGTLNEVVNGAAGHDHVAVTSVPLGTGNDFIRMFGPRARSLFSDLPALAAGPQAAFDLMDCNGRLGIDVVCAGVDARVAARVDRYKRLPLVRGGGAYALALAAEVLLRGVGRPMTVRAEGLDWEGRTAILCICNGRYYGGGFMPVGDAMPDDGILDVLLVPEVSLFTFGRLVGTYARGGYRRLRPLLKDVHVREVRYAAPEELVTVVDGEVLRGREFSVSLSDKKIWFFYPRGADYAPGTEEFWHSDPPLVNKK